LLHESKCKRILDQVVKLAQPRRVVLFGSSATSEKAARDLDFLIVVPDGTDCRLVARMLYRQVQRGGISIDLVVVTESEQLDMANEFWSVVHHAANEGKELYVA
jgi:predicted nucleotidyltransferase